MAKKKVEEEEKAIKKSTSESKKTAKKVEKKTVTKKAEKTEKKTTAKKTEKAEKKTTAKKAEKAEKKAVKKAEKTEKKVAKKVEKTIAKKAEKTSKKSLPKPKEKEKLPKPEDKKSLPKAKEKKALPKAEDKKLFPKLKTKKTLPKKLSDEEKDKKLLDKIKEFFSRNPDKTSSLDDELEQSSYMPEYYDLPYRYNETVVRILAQTPKRLFIYWDISDSDVERYRKAFGNDFFEKTYPVLLVHNEELNYTYEVPINDYANSWYLDIKDSKSKYTVKLGRKFKERPIIAQEVQEKVEEENINLQYDYIEIVSSNTLEAPNDHVLFETIGTSVLYRNVKTGTEESKDISTLISGIAKAYNIYDLYKLIYKDEFNGDMFDLNNPNSAGNPSSSITSSFFK